MRFVRIRPERIGGTKGRQGHTGGGKSRNQIEEVARQAQWLASKSDRKALKNRASAIFASSDGISTSLFRGRRGKRVENSNFIPLSRGYDGNRREINSYPFFE